LNPYAADLWKRAKEAMSVAERILTLSPDAAASRAYYAACYAVSALFALEDKTFTKHSAIEAAVHRDLVKSGRWGQALGADYSSLRDLRDTGDYGGKEHVGVEEAREAILAAKRILAAVREAASELEA
jgi:uncharacterized protein (UPF0332 family)